ncbi:MAG: hypothetical protein JSW05_05995 [Candidatus Thorarchaeota archaeon]|nr:MAG: hypothetical protein JSW05_05995 [Candidatus Thorarchaeota archaeon]
MLSVYGGTNHGILHEQLGHAKTDRDALRALIEEQRRELEEAQKKWGIMSEYSEHWRSLTEEAYAKIDEIEAQQQREKEELRADMLKLQTQLGELQTAIEEALKSHEDG